MQTWVETFAAAAGAFLFVLVPPRVTATEYDTGDNLELSMRSTCNINSVFFYLGLQNDFHDRVSVTDIKRLLQTCMRDPLKPHTIGSIK